VLRGVAVPRDLNATKSFQITETKSVQLRIDASNVLNHPVANTPQLSLAPAAGANALNTTFGQIIQAATKWPAETMRVDRELGTIEVGKLADLLIVDDDPLLNIANLQKIAFVIADGKVQPRGFQPWYWSPFGGEGPITIPVVDDLDWAVMLRGQPRGRGGARGGVGRPQPTIETLDSGRRDYPDPDFSKVVVKEGSPALHLKITGVGYFQRSVVYFNGVPVPTRLVNVNELEAQVDESLLRTPGRYSVVVRNAGVADPQKLGDGSSNRGWLIVGYR
jgi:hypothetical protein